MSKPKKVNRYPQIYGNVFCYFCTRCIQSLFMNNELKKIIVKVSELYMRYGIKSVTMDDVASHLSISKKTLYRYVSDKDDLVGKVIDLQIETLRTEMDCKCNTELNAVEELLIVSKMINHKMKNMNPGTIYDLKKYYPEHYKRFQVARREKMHSNIVNNIRKGKAEGIYRSDLDENIITKLQISRVENIIDNELFSVEEYTSNKIFQEIFVYHIRGIANQQGINFLENKLASFDIEDLNNI